MKVCRLLFGFIDDTPVPDEDDWGSHQMPNRMGIKHPEKGNKVEDFQN